MLLDRLLPVGVRLHRLVLYNFLVQYYRSVKQRPKRTVVNQCLHIWAVKNSTALFLATHYVFLQGLEKSGAVCVPQWDVGLHALE